MPSSSVTKDGNLHFVITQSFNDQAAVDQYARFIDDVVKLVVDRYDGALKAEHGTGNCRYRPTRKRRCCFSTQSMSP
jgi:FAD/FMN-containing dehydrogenase